MTTIEFPDPKPWTQDELTAMADPRFEAVDFVKGRLEAAYGIKSEDAFRYEQSLEEVHWSPVDEEDCWLNVGRTPEEEGLEL